MTVMTLPKYLAGNRQAILEIAGSRQSLWVGLLFVLSAGLAREYDGADLWHEPWHLVLPLGASLVTSFLLFCLVYAIARRRGCPSGRFTELYRSFVSLYWMTAPLAWFYATPVERFLSPADATAANLWLLALVSLWRVSLMTRVIAVLFQAGGWASFFVVMFFADTSALVVLYLTPIPIFQIMGGIRLSESEQIIQGTALLVGFLAVISWPIWLIAVSGIGARKQPEWKPVMEGLSARRIGPSLWGLAFLSLAVWSFVLPRTQSEQRLKWQVERDLRARRLEEAVHLLSAHKRADFPPHWDPPPRLGYGERNPSVAAVLKLAITADRAPWVLELFAEKFDNEAGESIFHHAYGPFAEDLTDEKLEEYLTLLEHVPNQTTIVKMRQIAFEDALRSTGRPEAIRERIRALYLKAGFDLTMEDDMLGSSESGSRNNTAPDLEYGSDRDVDSK